MNPNLSVGSSATYDGKPGSLFIKAKVIRFVADDEDQIITIPFDAVKTYKIISASRGAGFELLFTCQGRISSLSFAVEEDRETWKSVLEKSLPVRSQCIGAEAVLETGTASFSHVLIETEEEYRRRRGLKD